MLTVESARKILGTYGAKKTDAEIRALLAALALLAERALECAEQNAKDHKAAR